MNSQMRSLEWWKAIEVCYRVEDSGWVLGLGLVLDQDASNRASRITKRTTLLTRQNFLMTGAVFESF